MSESPRSEVHRATQDDATTVARLLHDFNAEYDEPTPAVPVLAERLRELLAAEEIAVLLAGDPPLGFALFRTRPSLWSKAGDTYLEELYVVPEQRGEGIGGALLDAAIEAARAVGADHFELTTGEDDKAAISLYKSRKLTNSEGGPDGPRMLYYELDLLSTS
jgi:ribosomal protein S18 acetylase RimI-like enzyme